MTIAIAFAVLTKATHCSGTNGIHSNNEIYVIVSHIFRKNENISLAICLVQFSLSVSVVCGGSGR